MTQETTHTKHNWPVYGHDWAVNLLRKAIRHGRTRHAYLITGVESVGKRTLAYSLAMALNAPLPDAPGDIDHDNRAARVIKSGNHPDIVLSQTDEKTGSLRIETIRDVTTRLALKPYEGRYRAAIMDEFERARPQAQDALLKTLEEPAQTSVLLLLATSTEGILPTITSRCQILSLRPVPAPVIQAALEHDYQLPPEDAELIARVSGGRIGWAVNAAQDRSALDVRENALTQLENALSQNRAGRFEMADQIGRQFNQKREDRREVLLGLDLWMTYWRDVLLETMGAELPITNIDRQDAIRSIAARIQAEEAAVALHATRETAKLLRTTNTNPRLALEVMFLDYPGL